MELQKQLQKLIDLCEIDFKKRNKTMTKEDIDLIKKSFTQGWKDAKVEGGTVYE